MSFRIASTLVLLIAASCQAGSGTGSSPAFSAARAFEHARKLVSIGPRPAGSDAIKKAQDYIKEELRGSGISVIEDAFIATTPKGAIPMKNIIGQVDGKKSDIVMITGHYDTKLQEGFVGANDGASSAATVLELAHALANSKPEYTLWFVLFDGEEAVVDWNAMNGNDNTYGSRHLASKLAADGRLRQVKAMILVDMIGDKNLNIKREGESTEWLVSLIWEAARAAGHGKVFSQAEQYISDDHLPFRDAGVPVADLIDFDYGPHHAYWHTNQDTLDKISGESMKVVGDVLLRALPDLFKRLDQGISSVRRPASSS
jgi:glutaminyl-peptide cyclotransferase